MRVSCGTVCVPSAASLVDRPSHVWLAAAVQMIRAAGYAAVEVRASEVHAACPDSEDTAADFLALLGRIGLELSSLTIDDLAAGRPADVDDWLRAIDSQMALARRLGLTAVNVGAGPRRLQPPEVLGEALRRAAILAGEQGMRLNIANRCGSRIEQLEDFRGIVHGLPAESARILVDCGEFHDAAVNPCHALREFRGRVGLLRVADRIGRRPVPLGEGEVNIPAVLETARDTGYDGWIVVTARASEERNAVTRLAAERVYLEEQVGK